MSSNTVTRNDLKNILNEVLPPTPSEYKKLLWTNSSSGSFAAQTISLDLSGYDCVEIWFYLNQASDPVVSNPMILSVGQRNHIALFHGLGVAGVNENEGARSIEVTSTGVTFGDYAYKNKRSGGTLTTANQWTIPNKIYGIKYERVSPPQVDAFDYVIEQGTVQTTNSTLSGPINWTYRKWNSGIAECWGSANVASRQYAANGGYYGITFPYPPGLFITSPSCLEVTGGITTVVQTDIGFTANNGKDSGQSYIINRNSSAVTNTAWAFIHALGTWK